MINKISQGVASQAKCVKNIFGSLYYSFAEDGGKQDYLSRGGD